MAPEDENVTSQQAAGSDEEQGTGNQASPSVIEINDSMTECEEESRFDLSQMEEKAFVAALHSFMKDRATPIERIPHLGFKQINLWRIYKAVEKLGGYDSVTARRLWKKVYDELGGSPGSTSAATCTRRHYEKLVLPFERHVKGEEDKPLPPSKPRKPYKRSLDNKVNKADRKKKRTQVDTERSPVAACHNDAVLHPHHALWTSDRHHQDGSQPTRASNNVCTTVYTRLVPVPTSSTWSAPVPPVAGEVISPLEKKKRMAQASLNLPVSPQVDDKERPSVIQCSQSPSRASSKYNCSSSDGSPLPLSSSSSRSPSPYSVSSEDSPEGIDDKPPSERAENCSSLVKCTSRHSSEESPSVSSSQRSKDSSAKSKNVSHVGSQSADSTKMQIKDSAWKPVHRETSKYIPHPLHVPSPYSVISDWPTSASSFTKVIPKSSAQLPRPAPIRPSYKIPQNQLVQQDHPQSSTKKQNNVYSWIFQTDKREKSRTMLQKVSSIQHSVPHSSASLPVPGVLSSYKKSGRDSRHQPSWHPAYLNNRMRLPQSQQMYRHVPVSPAHPVLTGSAVYPYHYPIPLLNPQTAYTLSAINPIYQHKM